MRKPVARIEPGRASGMTIRFVSSTPLRLSLGQCFPEGSFGRRNRQWTDGDSEMMEYVSETAAMVEGT